MKLHWKPKDKKKNIIEINLRPLQDKDVENLVADTFSTQPEKSQPLADWLYRKSAGNPFSLKQLLIMINDEGFLSFDMEEGRWKWDLEGILKLQQGEDVHELILKKIKRLPDMTRDLLILASFLGNKFAHETLASVCEISPEKTKIALMPAVYEGLIILKKENANTIYEFIHDRVQQAFYSLVTEDERKKRHVMIGSRLLQNTLENRLEENILAIMDHFNRGLELVNDPEKRIKLAMYNHMAGRKVKASAAFSAALHYFECARSLLSEDAWEKEFELIFKLYRDYAETLYLCTDAETAEKWFDILLGKAKTKLDRADVYGSKMILYAGSGRFDRAIETGIKALRDLGLKIPYHPTRLDFARELFLFKWYMRGKKIEDLLNLPEMHDRRKKKILELLTRLCYVTMSSLPDLYGLVIIKIGNFALRYGNNEFSSVSYMGYGIVSGIVFGDYEAGERFGSVGIQLAEKYNLSSAKCIIYFVEGALISHWTRHLAYSLNYLRKAVATGNEAGNFTIVGYAHCMLLEHQYIMGVPLSRMNEIIRETQEIEHRIKHRQLGINMAVYDSVVAVLSGREENMLTTGLKELEKKELEGLAENDMTSLATYYFYRMQTYYLAGEYRKALDMSRKLYPLAGAIIGFMIYAEYFFYESLIITSIYKDLTNGERRHYKLLLKKNLRKLRKWAQSCKDNFEHKYLLVSAQLACLENRTEEAIKLYDRAISSARASGFIQNEALACELAAEFYLERNMDRIAAVYLEDALKEYKKWGAFAKGKELEEKHPGLLNNIETDSGKEQSGMSLKDFAHISIPAASQIGDSMDYYFISKAMEKISAETDIDRLLEGFLDIVVRSSGADMGCIIIEKNGELFIEVLKETGSDKAESKIIPLGEYNGIAKSVVNYVARTLKTIVLNFGDQSGIFAKDSYLKKSNPKSVACHPLLLHNITFGVLYLENNFLPGVFTPKSIGVVKYLSAQIAYAKILQDYISGEIRGEGIEPANNVLPEPLTERETDVLELIARGMSNKEIADMLEITINTVKGHIKNIYSKLGVNRRLQAVNRAKALKLLKHDNEHGSFKISERIYN